MDEATARAMIRAHFNASNVGAAGGGPADDIVRASEIYSDDAVAEWPPGGERLRSPASWRSATTRSSARADLLLRSLGAAGLARPVGRAFDPREPDPSLTAHHRSAFRPRFT